jgi:hypothetical protein
MSTLASEVIDKMAQQPQAQYSLIEQLEELARAAGKLGLYDAQDHLVRVLTR